MWPKVHRNRYGFIIGDLIVRKFGNTLSSFGTLISDIKVETGKTKEPADVISNAASTLSSATRSSFLSFSLVFGVFFGLSRTGHPSGSTAATAATLCNWP